MGVVANYKGVEHPLSHIFLAGADGSTAEMSVSMKYTSPTLDIVENGSYDVKEVESVDVDVPGSTPEFLGDFYADFSSFSPGRITIPANVISLNGMYKLVAKNLDVYTEANEVSFCKLNNKIGGVIVGGSPTNTQYVTTTVSAVSALINAHSNIHYSNNGYSLFRFYGEPTARNIYEGDVIENA